MTVLDDIWNTLKDVPLQVAITILSAIFMPFVYVVLHPFENLYEYMALLINTIIGLANIFILLYNAMLQILPLYFSFFPSAWSIPLLSGILVSITLLVLETIKKYIPGWS